MFSRAALVLLGAFVIGACDDDETTAPSATSIEAVGATTTSGGAGTVAPLSPTVRVLNGGTPVQGVMVTFAVTQGAAGSVQYAKVLTDAQGIASAGTWTLGSYPGTHVVTASVEGLAPVTFTAAVGPGNAAQIAITAGNNQEADPGDPLAVSPSVRVTDLWNTIVPAGTTVTFTVTGGGGTIAGANQVTTTTNAQGIATVGPWVLGPLPGPQALRVTAGTGVATLAATARGPCDQLPPLVTVGSSTDGTLIVGNPLVQCEVGGVARDLYRFEVTAGQVYLIEMTGAAFPTRIDLQQGQGTSTVSFGGGAGPLRLFAGQSGTLIIGAGAVAAGQGGAYTLEISTTGTAINGCSPTNVMFGAGFSNLPQSIDNTDCSVTPVTTPAWNFAASFPADVIQIRLAANQSIRIIQDPTADLDGLLLVVNPNGARTFRDLGFDGGTEDFVYTASVAGVHLIYFTSYGLAIDDPWGHEFGGYDLSIVTP